MMCFLFRQCVRNIFSFCAVFYVVVLFQNSALADMSECKTAYEKEDNLTAFKACHPLAEEGNAVAQTRIGYLYSNGKGVAKDEAQALQWYTKAAQQGNATAQYNLGLAYFNGEGIAKNPSQAAQWFRKAAEQGYALAQYNLGVLYQNGMGVSQDALQAAQWYRKAADQGDAEAQNTLAWMYEKGQGVPQNIDQAALWYSTAAALGNKNAKSNLAIVQKAQADFKEAQELAAQGNPMSQYALGDRYENGIGVVPSNIQALKWYMKALDQGLEVARDRLADVLPKAKIEAEAMKRALEQEKKTPPVVMPAWVSPVLPERRRINIPIITPVAPQYADAAKPNPANTAAAIADFSKGVAAYKRNDYVSALKEFQPLAEQGNAKAQYNLGLMYDSGEGVPQSSAKALSWYRKAAAQGHPDAQFNLAVAYKNGDGVPKDMASAVEWYRKAAEQGDALAQLSLGMAYELGDGIAQDDVTALAWYRKAAAQANKYAQTKMGYMYESGRGGRADRDTATDWYRLAANQGVDYARSRLAAIQAAKEQENVEREQQAQAAAKQAQQRANAGSQNTNSAEECGWACMNARASEEALRNAEAHHRRVTDPNYGTGCNSSVYGCR